MGPSLGYPILVPAASSNLKPFHIPSSQKQGAGVLGAPGLAVVGAVEEACGAGPEPVTSHCPRAWGISVRDLRPRGRPARLNHVQVPAEDVVVLGTKNKKLGSSLGRQTKVSNLLSAHSVSPVTNCSAIEGAEYSPCGPPCPRSCDDLVVSLVPLDTPT